MEEALIIGLCWGIIGTLMIQALTTVMLRYARRPEPKAVPAIDPDATGKLSAMNARNERQGELIERLQQRIAVLKRITTDPGDRTARAIDALR